MQLKDHDYESLRQMASSAGWKVVCEDIDEKISAIRLVLETPTTDDMFGAIGEKSAEEKLAFLNYKKAELVYLRKLKELPNALMATQIKK